VVCWWFCSLRVFAGLDVDVGFAEAACVFSVYIGCSFLSQIFFRPVFSVFFGVVGLSSKQTGKRCIGA
jgi:hypothetical protein